MCQPRQLCERTRLDVINLTTQPFKINMNGREDFLAA